MSCKPRTSPDVVHLIREIRDPCLTDLPIDGEPCQIEPALGAIDDTATGLRSYEVTIEDLFRTTLEIDPASENSLLDEMPQKPTV
jgi:hypothetical protein